MEKRKWWIDKQGGLSDLDQFDRIYTCFTKEKDKFAVAADLDDNSEFILGWFDSKDEARAYIKEIYDFLISDIPQPSLKINKDGFENMAQMR
jgi:hypothetical protein